MSAAEEPGDPGTPGLVRLIAWMLALVVAGAPMVYVLWEAVNDLLRGHPEEIRTSVVLPVFAVFAVFVLVLARVVRRWDSSRESP